METIDVDQTYDPDSGLTLDEHRQIEFTKLTQSGFGSKAVVAQDNNDTIKPDNDEVDV